MSKCNGATALVRALKAEGVEVVFGYPGGAILPIYDALHTEGMRHVLTRHEQGAVHAAEGYAKATGRPGVVLGTSGPGATNLVTGLCDALMDSVPLVAITGQVSRSLMGRDSFQEADVLGITMSTTKQNYLVMDPSELLPAVREAFYLAVNGRKGPVLIDIPKDVSTAELAYEYPPPLDPWLQRPTPHPAPEAIQQAATTLLAAKRPLVICGGGIVNSDGAREHLLALVEHLQIPVVLTLHGLGNFPGSHPLCFGMLGMHGMYAANMAVQEADVLLAVGTRFDDRITGRLSQFAPKAAVIHVEMDATEINKNVPALCPLLGDAAAVLHDLLGAVAGVRRLERGDWYQQLRTWHYAHPVWVERRREFRQTVYLPEEIAQVAAANDGGTAPGVKPLRAEDVLRAAQTVFGPESIFVTDVGQHQMWAAQLCLRTEPRSFITSGGLGTMGFGLPAGIGVQLARPDRTVVVIAGDGSFQMTLPELGTMAANGLPLKVFIVNNGYLGMVRQWQELFYDRRYSAVDLRSGTPDFVQLAQAYGILAMRVDMAELVPWAMQKAQAYPGPIVIDFRVVEEENVYPMVAPGEANDRMILGSE